MKLFSGFVLGLIVLVNSAFATGENGEYAGVYQYQNGPEKVVITHLTGYEYKLENLMPDGSSRWEMLGYIRDGYLVTAYIDRPANNGIAFGVWKGQEVSPGTFEVTSAVVPPDPEVGITPDWTWQGVLVKEQ